MASFDEVLESALKADERFLDENGDLLREAVVNAAYNIDEKLVRILLDKKQPKVKEVFFIEIEKHWVFNINKFVSYIQDKNFLNDSYTQYKNKIGLTIDGKFLRERGEVSLVWPFKDGVLEGGMTKEDQDRKEIFFNETLAQDEIDKLFEKKVLTNSVRFTKEGKKKALPLKRNGEGLLEDNFVIKGNNLLALHSIKEQFKGQIKLIYIDPPYYFSKQKKEDTFEYNSNFKLSTWLTFMMNRLQVARDLLSEDGSLFVQISDDGVGVLHQLLKEVFNVSGQDNFVNKITIKTKSPSGFASVNAGVFETAEYIFCFAKNKKQWAFNEQYVKSKYDANYKWYIPNKDETYKKWRFVDIGDVVSKDKGFSSKREAIKTLGEPVFMELMAEFALKNSEKVFRLTAIADNASGEVVSARNVSKTQKDKIIHIPRKENYDVFIFNGNELAFYSKKIRNVDGEMVPSIQLSNIWTDVPYEGIASEGGVQLKGGKKPEKLIKRIIEIATNAGDYVLDYHLGSGTTAAVCHKLGRKYIGLEQLDEQVEKAVERLDAVIKGDTTGISKVVNWKGGGNFVYFELKKFNQDFIEQIESAGDTKKLLKVWEEMKQKAFFKHNFEMQKFEESLATFKALPIAQQKALLLEILDKNQLYVNAGDIDDKRFKISAEDKQLTKEFYGE